LEHVTKLVGRHAPEDLVRRIEAVTDAHHPLLKRDALRCYHAGEGVVVELEVVMPSETTVRQSHDICLSLQDAVEAMHEVERAFVHVDYLSRCYPEHKVERELLQHDVVSATDADGAITAALHTTNDGNRSDDDARGGGNDGGSGGAGSGSVTGRHLGGEGVEEPLLPPV